MPFITPLTEVEQSSKDFLMPAKLIHQTNGARTFAIVLSTDDEVMACMQEVIGTHEIDAAQFSAIGAFAKATLGYFDWESKDYIRNDINEQVEVASLIGDVALGPDGKPALHIHCVLGRRDGTAVAGHLLKAEVRPTLEIVLTDTPAHLRKRLDPESGLALMSL